MREREAKRKKNKMEKRRKATAERTWRKGMCDGNFFRHPRERRRVKNFPPPPPSPYVCRRGGRKECGARERGLTRDNETIYAVAGNTQTSVKQNL